MMTSTIRKKGLAAALGFAALASALPSVADDYRFIISGYPTANESYSAISRGETEGIVTATRRGISVSSALEARYRTRCESEGIGMRTDERRGLYIIIR